MLEFVREDRLPEVAEKIKNIYFKHFKTDKSEFANNFVNKYKDDLKVYGDDFYKENPELMYIDAKFKFMAHNDIIGSITDDTDTLTVIDVKEL